MAASAATGKTFVIIAGVGGGTGAAVARKFAKALLPHAAYLVVILARNPQNYINLVFEINTSGGKVIGAFAKIEVEHPTSALAAAIHYVGGGFVRKPFLELSEMEWIAGWESNGMGAFYFSQAALPLLLSAVKSTNPHPPTLIFTGATASLRGSAQCASLAAGKFALRALSQSLAREFGPKGVHVGHLVVDGVIATPARLRAMGGKDAAGDKVIDPGAFADGYWFLHAQPRSVWTAEMDIRPFVEKR